MYMYMDSTTACFGCVGFKRFDSGLLTYILLILPQGVRGCNPYSKARFLHLLFVKMGMSLRANRTPYFCSIFVATNSTYVSVSVRFYTFFHLCRMKTTNTAKKKKTFHRDEPYKDISREEYMR